MRPLHENGSHIRLQAVLFNRVLSFLYEQAKAATFFTCRSLGGDTSRPNTVGAVVVLWTVARSPKSVSLMDVSSGHVALLHGPCHGQLTSLQLMLAFVGSEVSIWLGIFLSIQLFDQRLKKLQFHNHIF